MDTPIVTVVTCTGWRPEAFKLCERHMRSQTYPYDRIRWIVVSDDDPKTPTPTTMNQIYIPGPLIWQEGYNTQRFNMTAGLDKAKEFSDFDHLLIWEDDDFYKNDYISEMVKLLGITDVAGEGAAKYYNLRQKCSTIVQNYAHTSLCQLGIRRKAFPILEKALHSGEIYFDTTFWSLLHQHPEITSLLFVNRNLSIAIKGLPGRTGIGMGHRNLGGWDSDPFGIKLQEWLGHDWRLYEPYIPVMKPRPKVA